MKRLLTVAIGLTLLSLAVASAGCVRTRHYRYVQQQNECFTGTSGDPMPGVAGERRLWPSLECRHTLYKVGYIEFDEDGTSIDPLQATKTLRMIDEVRRHAPNGRIITVVYVHGWKNNASEAPPGGKDKDVEKFLHALAELGNRSRNAADKRARAEGVPIERKVVPIVGVYMAWRGKTLMGPSWFNFLSFWGRRNAANRVGEGPAFTSSLTSVIDKVNEPVDGRDTGSRVLLVGHSFGARVLEHAIEMRNVRLHRPIDGSKASEPIVDLALYVNSANDARLTVARLEQLRAHPIEVRHPDYKPELCRTPEQLSSAHCGQYPLLVAVTSRGDYATKYVLPIANTVNLDKSVPIPAAPSGVFVDRTPKSAIFRRAAAAHMTFLQSHVIRETPCPPFPAPASPAGAPGADDDERRLALEQALHPTCAPGDRQCRFVFRTQGEHPTCFQADQRSASVGDGAAPAAAGSEPYNSTAFWIMDVDPAVIKDHGDIWNLSFVEMLAQLMAPRGFFEPDGGRVQLRAAPAR
jgi:hypothetical protein